MQPNPIAETSRLLFPSLRLRIVYPPRRSADRPSEKGFRGFYSLLNTLWYCSSLTCSIQLTALPLSFSTMAICDIAVADVAPCQCFLPGGHQTTSPGRISSLGSPQHCVQPHPEVTINVCPSGWVCHAVRAPGSNVTNAP